MKNQDVKKNRSKGDLGFTLLEVVIAIALLALFAILVTNIPAFKSISKRLVTADQCTSRADEVVSAFLPNSNKLNVSNWHPMGIDTTPPPFSFGMQRLPAGMQVSPLVGTVTPSTINSWALIDASYNWLAQYYNTDPNICTMNGPGQLLAPPMPFFFGNPFTISANGTLKGERIYLNVQQKNLSDHSVNCTRPAVMLPSNATNVAGGTPPTGLFVTARVVYTGQDGNDHSCEATTLVKPDADNTPPAPMGIATITSSLDLNPAPGVCGTALPAFGAATDCLCDAPSGICLTSPCTPGAPGCTQYGGPTGAIPGYASYTPYYAKHLFMNQVAGTPAVCANPVTLTERVALTTVSSEPATIYSCSLASTAIGNPAPPPSGNYLSCNSFATGPSAGSITARMPTSTAPGATTGIRFDLANVPVGMHTASFQATDSSRNSSQSSLSFAVIDPCPATWTDQFCPPPAALAPDQCGNPNVCTGTKPPGPCPDRMSAVCGTPLFDDCGRACPSGMAQPPDTFDPTYKGAKPDACGWCTIKGTCVDPAPPAPPTCPVVPACVPPSITPEPPCSTISCPNIGVSTNGGAYGPGYSPGPSGAGGIGQLVFTGTLANCTSMEYVGTINPSTGQPYGPIPIAPINLGGGLSQTAPIDFGYGAGGAGASATRDLSITCGGVTQTFRYQATCNAGLCTLTCNGCYNP